MHINHFVPFLPRTISIHIYVAQVFVDHTSCSHVGLEPTTLRAIGSADDLLNSYANCAVIFSGGTLSDVLEDCLH